MSETTEPVVVRALREGEEQRFLAIHRRSVRGLAAWHYPPEVIDSWSAPITGDALRAFHDNVDHEIRLIAERRGEPVAIGALVVAGSELRACYVVPEAAGCGVGRAVVHEIERRAREHGLDHLELLASINAEPFYARLGYRAVERTEHVLRDGQAMAAVKMIKSLREK